MKAQKAVELVRVATRERHVMLESMPSQGRLLAEDYRLDEYRSLLERLYGFYDALEVALQGNALWRARVAALTALLANDLRDLGLTPADFQTLARCKSLPLLDSSDRVLGCAYVIEGATLGGQIITRHLERVFGDRAHTPLRFFAGDGKATGARWQQSCAVVNAESANIADVCAAACATFDALAAWLAEPVPLEVGAI